MIGSWGRPLNTRSGKGFESCIGEPGGQDSGRAWFHLSNLPSCMKFLRSPGP
jgi:hypothetical protein